MNPTVIDFFCGAGGFSEGFRQIGFDIISGYDYWQPAIDTFNYNFGLECSTVNILKYEHDLEAIENLPNTSVILGSPPCVSFSSSNKSGKAEKKDGIRLTKAFLRIIAVKKYMKDSRLEAWFMENVTNSTNYLQGYYTFKDLNLTAWAKANRYSPEHHAITLEGNHTVIDSSEYGSPQKRRRVISGEIIKMKKLVVPQRTHGKSNLFGVQKFNTLRSVIEGLPCVTGKQGDRYFKDPNYDNIRLHTRDLTDHYYDTGLHESVWRQSRYLKTNHPYMGRMSFPEDINRPARTVTATKIGSSREAHIYLSEYNRIGDGQYRTPTIREMACIMGFPVTYQFLGTEGMKSRLVGNAVCPSVSRALAQTVREAMRIRRRRIPFVMKRVKKTGLKNLNDFCELKFGMPPRRNKNSRFRRHILKDGNITVSLSNYDILQNEKTISHWRISLQYGNGRGFPSYNLEEVNIDRLESIISNLEGGNTHLNNIYQDILPSVASNKLMQEMYESQTSTSPYLEPTQLIDTLKEMIDGMEMNNHFVDNTTIENIFPGKNHIPASQILALHALSCVLETMYHTETVN